WKDYLRTAMSRNRTRGHALLAGTDEASVRCRQIVRGIIGDLDASISVSGGFRPKTANLPSRGMRNLSCFFVLLVPDASARFQGRAMARCGASIGRRGGEHGDQMTPKTADQAGQVRWQGGEPPLPGAAGWQPAVLVQERPQLLGHRIVLVEKRQQGVGR